MISLASRQTKIIWSFESKSLTSEIANIIASQDFDCLRISFDPQDFDRVKTFLPLLKFAREKAEKEPIPVMVDMSSRIQPKISSIKESKDYNYEEKLTLGLAGSGSHIEIECENFTSQFQKDSHVFIAYGKTVLKVIEVTNSKQVLTQVVQGGPILKDNLIHIPDSKREVLAKELPLKEMKSLIDEGIEYVVIPSLLKTEDLGELKSILTAHNPDHKPWIFLTIDSFQACQVLDEQLPHIDGVFISRRELALTVNPATVPMVTKEIVQRCIENAKAVLIASDMLSSLRYNPTPTRAEVSDIANAVIDGTDAVVLSEEVTFGDYNLKAVNMMSRIIDDIESQAKEIKPNWKKTEAPIDSEFDAIAWASYKTAIRVQAKAIVCITHEGNTALKLASFRTMFPIIAVCFSSSVQKKLNIIRGVEPILLDVDPNIDQVLPVVNDLLVKRTKILDPGDVIVFVSITLSSLSRESSNLFSIQRLS